jgi:hypothetical protein
MLPQRFFLRRRQVWVAQDMDNAAALDDTVRPDHLRYRKHRGDLHYWDTGLFELSGDRSTAASGCPSRGGEDNRIHPILF